MERVVTVEVMCSADLAVSIGFYIKLYPLIKNGTYYDIRNDPFVVFEGFHL